MITLTIPDNIEQDIKDLAAIEKHATDKMALQLIVEAIAQHKKQQADEEDALKIHEQLIDQYADTFEKLAK